MSALSDYLEITENELDCLDIEVQENTGSSGEMVYGYYFHVPEDAPKDILDKKGWTKGEYIELPLNLFDEPDS